MSQCLVLTKYLPGWLRRCGGVGRVQVSGPEVEWRVQCWSHCRRPMSLAGQWRTPLTLLPFRGPWTDMSVIDLEGPCVACLGSAEYIPSFNLYNWANYSCERPNNAIHQSGFSSKQEWAAQCQGVNSKSQRKQRVSGAVWLSNWEGVLDSVLVRLWEKRRRDKNERMGDCACVCVYSCVCVCIAAQTLRGPGGTETPNECVFVLRTPHTSVYLDTG